MPLSLIVTYFSGVFVGALVVKYAQQLVDGVNGIGCCIRLKVRSAMPFTSAIDLKGSKVIQHVVVTQAIRAALESKTGGITIIGLPSGSGKSTYVQKAVLEFVRETKTQIKFTRQGHTVLQRYGLHTLLGISHLESISTYIPEGSVILIDQVDLDISGFDNDMSQYIVQLATDSRNTKKYSVIICVSNPEVYRRILNLNGGQKIKSLSDNPATMKWSQDQMTEYILWKYPSWTAQGRIDLLTLFSPASSPGALWDAMHKIEEDPRVTDFVDISEATKSKIGQIVTTNKLAWDAFEAVHFLYAGDDSVTDRALKTST